MGVHERGLDGPAKRSSRRVVESGRCDEEAEMGEEDIQRKLVLIPPFSVIILILP